MKFTLSVKPSQGEFLDAQTTKKKSSDAPLETILSKRQNNPEFHTGVLLLLGRAYSLEKLNNLGSLEIHLLDTSRAGQANYR